MDPTVDDFGEYKLQLTSGGISGGAAALQWGPDGLLYVVGRQGFVYAIEVERTTQLIDDPENPGNQIEVTDEYLGTIKWSAKVDTPNFNDIGGTEQLTGNNAGNPVGSNRQALGVAVTTDETTGETVVYVSHSDITIGAGTSGTDKGLDTNSGVITRYTLSVDGQKDVTENEAIDIVRGLPRSEENHASNGMAFTTGPNGEPLLLLAQGGHANAGATSNNFSGLAEYAYSASILSIDLNQIASIEAERKAGDPNADYVYDLPTLDDPTRGNYKDANGDDILIDTNFDGVGDTVAEYTGTITQAENDDFVANNLLDTNNDGVVDTILGDEDDNPTGVRGGNDGLNQAKLTVGSPVQVYAYGYRNPYDVLVTEDGKKLSYDNGANGGWGGPPLTESGAPDPDGVYTGPGDGPLVTNAPNPNQGTGSQGTANFDNLHFFEQGDHAGHAHPLQARGADAGWWTSPGSGTNGAEQLTDTPLGAGSPTPGLTLPADWDEIVDPSLLNPEAGDYREGGITDGAVDTGKGSWNGLAEYTGTAFGEEFKGAILATQTGGTVKWIKRNEQGGIDVNPGGGAAVAADQGVVGNTGGGNTLGIDAVGDLGVDGQFGGAFNNTIWVGHLGQDQGSNITIFEANGVPTPPSDNNDGDAFNNTVDVFDYSTTQGVNTLLDDNDTPSTADDVFNLLSAGQSISYENSAESYADTAPGGIGVVGMMINGEDKAFVDSIGLDGVTPTGEDGLRSFSANVVPGGAGSGLQIKDYFSGTAKGTANDQIDAFTYAASFDQSVGAFQITGVMAISESGFARDGSEAGVQMGVGNQSNYLSMVLAVSGSGSGQTASIDVYYEEDDAEVASQSFDITAAFDDFNFDGADLIEFRFFADAIRGTVTPQFRTYAVSETPPAFTSLDTVDLTGDVLDAVRGQYVANGATSALAFGNIGTSDLELGEAPALGNVTYDRFQVDAFAPIVDAFVEISDVAADEDAGTASITLSLVDAQGALVTLGDSVEVDLSVGGSASSGSDYTVSIPSTETFASGENQKTYVFSIVDDAVSESTETVDVEITEIRGSNGLVVIPTNGETVGTVTISDDDQPVVAYRINAGGPTLTATDDGPDWASGSNTATLPDGVTLNTANQSVHALQGRYDGPTTASGGTAAPDYVPDALFVTERWDPAADPEMIWTFAVDAGTTYAVRLFMSNGFTGTSSSGERVFDVEIEGSPIFENIDLSGQFGHQTGGMFEYVYQAGDDLLEIEFIHKVENPLINGFEILNLDADAGPDVIAPEVASIEATEPATSADPITVTVVF
ncbi:MAG: malectin domain-containing carbohydrate-binding protein, partial [Pseudomonadota bacterium]